MSSSAPGASPTNIRRACGSPTPKTTVFRDAARLGHFTHARARRRRSAKAAACATGSSLGGKFGVTSRGEAGFGAGEFERFHRAATPGGSGPEGAAAPIGEAETGAESPVPSCDFAGDAHVVLRAK